MSYEVQVRRGAELDLAEAQIWYETQQTGLGAEFRSEVAQVIDRLAATPLIYSKRGLDSWINQTMKDFIHALRRVRHARIKPPFQQSKKFAG